MNNIRTGLLLLFLTMFGGCKLPFYTVPFSTWNQQKAQLQSELSVLPNDFEKTTRLRQFVAQHVDLGENSINCSQLGIEFWDLSAQEYFDLFLSDEITAYCGGTSYFLLRVYEEFGYEAYTYNVGGSSTYATHQFNLVKVVDGNDEKLILQDAYFDHSIVHAETMAPIDFKEAVSFLEQGQADSIILRKTYSLGNTLKKAATKPSGWQISELADVYRYRSVNNEVPFLFRSERSIDTFLNSTELRNRYCDFLRLNGHACDLKYLFLYPIGDSKNTLSKVVLGTN